MSALETVARIQDEILAIEHQASNLIDTSLILRGRDRAYMVGEAHKLRSAAKRLRSLLPPDAQAAVDRVMEG